jgi:transcription-repair coupling factor (superfamily II helicase)
MPQIRTLKDLDNGNKLGDTPANYYPSSRTDLEEQLSCAKKDREVAIYWGSQFADNYDVLDREKKRMQDDLDKSKNENEKLSDRVHQLGEEIRQLHLEKNELMLQITRKDISLADAKSKFSIKSEEMQAFQSKTKEEIQALQSRVKELEQDVSLAQDDLSEMESLKRKLELENVEVTSKNIGLSLAKDDLEDSLTEKKDELAQIKDDLVIARKALIEKESLLQEAVLKGPANDRLAEQISQTSSESEVLGGVSRLEKDNGITSPETTSVSPYSLFFQHAIIFVIVLLIIYFLWRIFSRLYSSNSPYNEEKNIPNYKIPLNRNQSYAFPIRYAEEPKDRTTPYETLPYGYG